jgi:hypothetical protein
MPIAQYPVQSVSYSQSWGTEPAQCNLVYVSESAVPLGAAARCSVGPYYFAGVCESDLPLTSSRGNKRELVLRDYRKYLTWDQVYGSWNNIDDKIIDDGGGSGYSRLRRYWHYLPWDFPVMRKSWSLDNYSPLNSTWRPAVMPFGRPYSAAELIYFVLTAPGVETPWTVAYLDADGNLHDGYHPNMLAGTVYNLDAMRGKDIGTLLSEICGELGLLFTIRSTDATPFRLVFAQKGVDGPTIDPTTVPYANDIQNGTELSGNPTRIRVLGDRNLYQVHDISLQPDWNQNWNQFSDFNLFTRYVYENFITWDESSDPEHIIAQQNALSLAWEMTLAEFDTRMGGHGTYLDPRKYAGKARNNMPCALYINNILFRCFRLPSDFWFRNTYGSAINQYCVELQDKLLTKVTHDPITGLTQWDATKCVDGNAYVIVQGYQIGKDLFETIRPERFNLAEWTSKQDIWQKIECRLEDGGDVASTMIVFDEPVIMSDDLVQMIGGYAVFRAKPTITVPKVRATLTFAAETFSWFQTDIMDALEPGNDPVMGTQVCDAVLNIPGLNGEFVLPSGHSLIEIPYADNKTCRIKAIENGNNHLKFQWINTRGRFTVPFDDTDTAWNIHGKCDRVSLSHGPQGSTVTVSLANERQRVNFVPERSLDRMRQLNTLFPGQQESVKMANAAKKISAAVKTNKDAYKLLSDAFHGIFGEVEKAKPVFCTTAGTYAAGSAFVKEPNVVSGGTMTKTLARPQQGATATHKEFAGVTVRDGETIGAQGSVLRLQREGRALSLVAGPVDPGDSVGIDPARGDNALTKSPVTAAGVARDSIATATTALIMVDLGGFGGNGGGLPVWL